VTEEKIVKSIFQYCETCLKLKNIYKIQVGLKNLYNRIKTATKILNATGRIST
jgi:hypothetical protein